MPPNRLAAHLALPGILALAIAAGDAQGQDDRGAPDLALGLSPAALHALDAEIGEDLRALDAFAGRRTMDRASKFVARPKPWTLYGRIGVLNFQNELAGERGTGLRFGLRRTGPRLTGRVYIGVHRQF